MSTKPGYSDDDDDRELDGDDDLDGLPPLDSGLPGPEDFGDDDFDDFDDEFDDDFEEELEDEYGLESDLDLQEEALAEEDIDEAAFAAELTEFEEPESEEITPYVHDAEEEKDKPAAEADDEDLDELEDDA